MDNFRERFDALERQTAQLKQQTQALEAQTRAVKRRLRWWRGLACGLAVLGLLGWGLPLSLAREDARDKDKDQKGLAQRVAALETLLKHFSREGNDVTLKGANLHIVNGLGQTACGTEEEPMPDCPNGLGNLIVGYNEPRDPEFSENIRTGSHNVVVGAGHNFSRFGGLVVGQFNTIRGNFASVSGGLENTASSDWSAASGGFANGAEGNRSSVSGGDNNLASGERAAVSGGDNNLAIGEKAVVSGGRFNTASGFAAAVSRGGLNPNTGEGAGNTASGISASVSGGQGNIASGDFSSVSGGRNITKETDFGWSTGSEADEVVVGNFRSP
jgi:hypothetical protein